MVIIKDSRGKPLSFATKLLITHPDACRVAAAVIGGAVISAGVGAAASSSAASKQANAATSAAGATLEATQETNALNYQIYMQNLANLSPQMQVQQEAESALASGFGLGTPNVGSTQIAGGTSAPSPYGPDSNTFQATTQGTPAYTPPSSGIPGQPPAMSTIGGGGPPTAQTMQVNPFRGGTPSTGSTGIVGNTMNGPGASVGVGGSAPAASYGAIPPTNGGMTLSGGPSTYTGVPANGIVNAGANQVQLNSGGASQKPGSLLANFNNTDLNSQLSPSYGFILGQGQTQLQNYDAAHGISGGNATNAQTQFTENTASTFYQQAFQNYLTQQQQNISSLSSLAGNGATFGANAAGTSAGQTIGGTTMAGVGAATGYQTGAAAASAAGTVGSANALTGAIGSGTSGLMLNKLISNQTAPQYGAPADTSGMTQYQTGYQPPVVGSVDGP